MKRRTLLGLATAAAILRGHALVRPQDQAIEDPRARRHPLHRPAHDGAGAATRPHADVLQSRQDQGGSLPGSRTHQGRSRQPDRRAQGSRVGRGHRQLRLRATACTSHGRVAGAESAAIRVHVLDLRVPGFQRAARREIAGGQTRRRNHRESRRRNLWPVEGAVRAGSREGPARPHHHHPARASSSVPTTIPTASPGGRRAPRVAASSSRRARRRILSR